MDSLENNFVASRRVHAFCLSMWMKQILNCTTLDVQMYVLLQMYLDVQTMLCKNGNSNIIDGFFVV